MWRNCGRRTGSRRQETTSGARRTGAGRLRWYGSRGRRGEWPCGGCTSTRDDEAQALGGRRERSLRLLGHVARWQRGAFAEEEIFHMFGNELLCFLLPRHQAVLVQDHLHPLFPELPGVDRHVVVDALAELAGPRHIVEPRQLLLKLDAEDLSAALVSTGSRRLGNATVSHGGIVPLATPNRPQSGAARALLGGRARRSPDDRR